MNGRIHRPPRVSIVYESMFGNTRRIAEAISEGLRETVPVDVAAVHRLEPWPLEPDIVIVGAPTHVHGLSRPSTRSEAARWAEDGASRAVSSMERSPRARRNRAPRRCPRSASAGVSGNLTMAPIVIPG